MLLQFVANVLVKLSSPYFFLKSMVVGCLCFFLSFTSLKHWNFQWNCRLEELDYVRRENGEEKKGCGEEN